MSKNTDTTNTQGLDALAALCGFTAEASDNNAPSAAQPSAMNSAPEVGLPAPTNNGASNLQMLLQLQALNSAAQRAQQQRPQSQAPPAAGPSAGLPPQIMMALQAAAEQQQAIAEQQQKQQAQALAAQLIMAAQQQQQQQGANGTAMAAAPLPELPPTLAVPQPGKLWMVHGVAPSLCDT